jgi:acetyl esterase/lipase
MASPQLQKFVAGFPACMMEANDSLETVREKMYAIHPRGCPDDTVVDRVEMAGVPCAFISGPDSDASHTVFFVHGGAFVSTGLAEYLTYGRSIADFCRARVLVFEYTLAPELRYPGQLEETLAVWRASGLDPERTAFMGDSCGGGIALAALCKLRDAGEALPACYVGLTPWLDARQEGDAALHPRGVDPFVNAAWVRARFRDCAGGADLDDPFLSPLRADLTGLPPLHLGVGTIDTTSDDSTRLAARAAQAGVQVSLDIVAEHIHGLHGLAGMCPESDAAMERVGDFVRRAIP